MATKNTPVGTSECPIKNCTHVVPVFKYASASADQSKRRFAGRLYCVCPVDGRVENQEFLLGHIKWSDGKKPAESKPVDASSPVATPTQPAPPSPKPAAAKALPVESPKPAPIKAQPWFLDFWSK